MVSEVWSASPGDRRPRQRVILLMEIVLEVGGDRLASNEKLEVSDAHPFGDVRVVRTLS